MAQTNHGAIEFLKFPNPQYPGDATKMIKKWLRDSWARRKIVELQQALAPTTYTTFTPASSRCTYDAGGYVKVGKLVVIDVTLTMAANIGTSGFTQIAAADAALAPLKGSGYVALNAVNQTSATKATKAKMADDGRLLLHNVAAGDVVYVSGSYISV